MEQEKQNPSQEKLDLVQKKLDALYKTDGWINLVAGLGGKMDKSKHTYFDTYYKLQDEELVNMYIGDGYGGKIIDAIADDMTREWIRLEGDNEDNAVMKELKRLKAEINFNQVLKWNRLFGGSIMLIGVMDGQRIDKPVNINRIKSIDYLKPIDRTNIQITSSKFEEDPMKPNFGQVTHYKVSLQGSMNKRIPEQYIHVSRVMSFFGNPVPKAYSLADQEMQYWGASELQRIYTQLKDVSGIMGNIGNLLFEFIIGKYKMSNLAQKLSSGKEADIIKRVEIINLVKSMIHAILLGENEDYTRDTASLAGLSDIIDRFYLWLSGVTDIPVTRLFGRSPAGLNATGESDLENYYAKVASKQKLSLTDPLNYLISLIISQTGFPAGFRNNPPTIVYNPLKLVTKKEEAEIDKIKAETERIQAEADRIRMEDGILDAPEIEEMRYPEHFQNTGN